MRGFENWIADNIFKTFYLWVKSTTGMQEYVDRQARTCQIADYFIEGDNLYVGLVFCNTAGEVYSKYIEYYNMSEIRLGIPDFEYENKNERGDIK